MEVNDHDLCCMYTNHCEAHKSEIDHHALFLLLVRIRFPMLSNFGKDKPEIEQCSESKN